MFCIANYLILLYYNFQVLAYVDDINLIGDIKTVERNENVLLNACKDIG